jgi:hypothetical protein
MKIYQVLFALLPFLGCHGQTPDSASAASSTPGETKVPVVFTGGHDTYGPDRGRPVVLVAAGLGVPAEVFRQAFSKVHPAPAGQEPATAQVRLNKQALMESLSPYGVTDARLNEVSNFYRYRRESGELWKHTDAQAVATVRHGAVTSITITNPGAGYSSLPQASLAGMPNIVLTPVVSFAADLAKNGSITVIKTPSGTN